MPRCRDDDISTLELDAGRRAAAAAAATTAAGDGCVSGSAWDVCGRGFWPETRLCSGTISPDPSAEPEEKEFDDAEPMEAEGTSPAMICWRSVGDDDSSVALASCSTAAGRRRRRRRG